MELGIFGRPWGDMMGSMSGSQTTGWDWNYESQHMGIYVVGFAQGRLEVEVNVEINGKSAYSKTERGNFFATIDLGKFEKGQRYGIKLEWKTKGTPWQGIAFVTDEYPDGKVPKSPWDTKDPCVFSRLAESLVDYERTHEANLLLDIILKKNPQCSYAWYAKGELMTYWKDPRQAQSAYERALSLNQKHVGALRGLGSVLVSNGQLKQSKEKYRSVLDYPDGRAYDFGISIAGYLLLEVIDGKSKDARELFENLKTSVKPDTYNAKVVEASILALDQYEGKKFTINSNDSLLHQCLGNTAHQIRKLSDDISRFGSRELVQSAIRLARGAEKLLPDI